MRYELQTTLGVTLDDGDLFEQVLERLHLAMKSALEDPEYASVAAFQVVEGGRPDEITVGIRFQEGVKAEYVDDVATEILMKALEIFTDEDTELREESVRLQSVYA